MRTWVLVAAAYFCNPMNGTCEEPQEMDVESVGGRWELQTYTNEGVIKDASDPNTTFQGQRIQLADGKWVAWWTESPFPPAVEPDDTKVRFRVRPAKPFGHFDYWCVGSDGKPSGWKKIGIYKLDGDQLTTCFRVQEIPGPPIKRPRRFDASKGTYAGLAVYKRLGAKE